jgi:hypothetical protein
MPPQQGQTLLDLGGEIGNLCAHGTILIRVGNGVAFTTTRQSVPAMPAAPADFLGLTLEVAFGATWTSLSVQLHRNGKDENTKGYRLFRA